MIKKIFNSKADTVTKAAIVLIATSLICNFVGLYRERVLLGLFGASRALDIYYAAFRVPDFVYYFLVYGVISIGFIPIFISYLQHDKKKSWYLANDVLNLILSILITTCALMWIFMPRVIKFVAPGFEPESLTMTVKLARVMLLSPIFLGMSALFGGILQSFRRFLIFSLAPILYNLGIIFGALVLTKHFGLIGLSYGVVLGAFLHLAIQLPTAYLCGFRWRPVFDWKFSGLRRVLRLVGPRFMSVFCNQAAVWIFTAFASFLVAGSITAYNTAYNIFSFPLVVLGLSFAVAAFPKLAESAQKNNKKEYIKTFSLAFRQILFCILPAAALLIVLRLQIIQVAFKTGQFTWQNTIIIGQALMLLCLGLFGESLAFLLVRGFLAWEDAWTPLIFAFLTAVLRVFLGWHLAHKMGVAGLALSFAIGSAFEAMALFIFLRQKIGHLDGHNIFMAVVKILAVTLAAAGLAYAILNYLTSLMPATNPSIMFLKGGVAGVAGLVVYFLLAWLFRLDEFQLFISSLSQKLSFKKLPREME